LGYSAIGVGTGQNQQLETRVHPDASVLRPGGFAIAETAGRQSLPSSQDRADSCGTIAAAGSRCEGRTATGKPPEEANGGGLAAGRAHGGAAR